MLKVAIIGAGYMAKEHIKAFQDIKNVQIIGIYSRTYLNAQNLALNTKYIRNQNVLHYNEVNSRWCISRH